jgi:hypothetical protein
LRRSKLQIERGEPVPCGAAKSSFAHGCFMTLNDGTPSFGRRSRHGVAAAPLRRAGATPAAIASILLAAAALAGCSFSDGVGPYIVDAGRYSAFHCNDLVARLKQLLVQEKELTNLMDKASEGAGGTVIGALSYRTDYEKAIGEEKVLRRTAAEKKCQLEPPAYESDQIIR